MGGSKEKRKEMRNEKMEKNTPRAPVTPGAGSAELGRLLSPGLILALA